MGVALATSLETEISIDLASVAPSERLDFWNEVICLHYSPSYNRTALPLASFSASLRSRKLGRVDISSVKSAPLISTRNQQSIRTDPLDCFFISVLTEGEARLTQNGRKASQRAGDFVMYDSAQPFEYEMMSDYAGIWIRLPRNLVTTRMANPGALTARTLPGHCGIGRLANTMLHEAMAMEMDVNNVATSRIANSLLDILAATFETDSSFTEKRPHHINLLDHAKSFMLTNLEDADLDIETIVEKLGVSRRTLNRLFASEDTSPIRWLWLQRLDRAKMMLESGDEDRVTTVALACGFNDFSHFSRTFKAQFGLPPKAVLKQRVN